jgi:hypothetical protein
MIALVKRAAGMWSVVINDACVLSLLGNVAIHVGGTTKSEVFHFGDQLQANTVAPAAHNREVIVLVRSPCITH